ncbi:P-loop containing nucleoside triphosphate hydrolase protein [Lineolata rhizophorae]|uniref:RNA helicase n=1 Tax=Lineolata rhizophorae TaxID=578093 RepID=A0A6A6P534_9PEZI|nr:P-loop containing nucleoside triphosphate hydrolase protein [Lineolata rhizophorae]
MQWDGALDNGVKEAMLCWTSCTLSLLGMGKLVNMFLRGKGKELRQSIVKFLPELRGALEQSLGSQFKEQIFKDWRNDLRKRLETLGESAKPLHGRNITFWEAYHEDPDVLRSLLHGDFLTYHLSQASDRLKKQAQARLADLRYPTEWYPDARRYQRNIHLHVGPTNSGKTYHALKKLEEAGSGLYAGPLRLLAHEVYTRINATGRPCALVTGEEKRVPESNEPFRMASCTVEMAVTGSELDVAVIDEIQMLASRDRGWAWSQALFGLKAKQLHLCGEERVVPIIREFAAAMGDKLHIHRYKRLSPLDMDARSLNGDLHNLRKGDCVVSFSVMGIHALRKQIEDLTGKNVAMVYGSLPPETRAQQARLFNDPDNDYDFLVASDAIGMGLNLNIKRVVFESSSRFDGTRHRPLMVSEMKQIAGRAGRYKVAPQESTQRKSKLSESITQKDGSEQQEQATGLVTTLEKFDYPMIAHSFHSEPEPLLTAGIFPPVEIIERFASYFPPGTPFSYILVQLHGISSLHRRFHLCDLRTKLQIADVIEPVKGLEIAEKIVLSNAPYTARDNALKALFRELAYCVAERRPAYIPDLKALNLEILDRPPTQSRAYLHALESLHKGIVLYLWLSYRFPGIFVTQPLAFHVKALTENAIEQTLSKLSFTEQGRQKARERREKSVLESLGKALENEKRIKEMVRSGDEDRGADSAETMDPADGDPLAGADMQDDQGRETGGEDISPADDYDEYPEDETEQARDSNVEDDDEESWNPEDFDQSPPEARKEARMEDVPQKFKADDLPDLKPSSSWEVHKGQEGERLYADGFSLDGPGPRKSDVTDEEVEPDAKKEQQQSQNRKQGD